MGSRPGGRGALLFALGATLAFTLTEAALSRLFERRIRPERDDVVLLGSAMAPVSVSLGLGAAALCASFVSGAAAWFAASFAATMVYLLASGVELGLARLREEKHPPKPEA